MIPEDTLSSLEKKGSLKILVSLNEGKSYISELKEAAEISNGTIQKRLKTLVEAGLISENTDVDNKGMARKVYSLTDRGQDISNRILQPA